MAPSLPWFSGAPLKVDATTSMRWNKWGDQAVVELAAGDLKTLETRRMTTTKTMKFGDSSHRLLFRSPLETPQTFPPPAHLTHATSAFRAMKVLQAVAGVIHPVSSD